MSVYNSEQEIREVECFKRPADAEERFWIIRTTENGDVWRRERTQRFIEPGWQSGWYFIELSNVPRYFEPGELRLRICSSLGIRHEKVRVFAYFMGAVVKVRDLAEARSVLEMFSFHTFKGSKLNARLVNEHFRALIVVGEGSEELLKAGLRPSPPASKTRRACTTTTTTTTTIAAPGVFDLELDDRDSAPSLRQQRRDYDFKYSGRGAVRNVVMQDRLAVVPPRWNRQIAGHAAPCAGEESDEEDNKGKRCNEESVASEKSYGRLYGIYDHDDNDGVYGPNREGAKSVEVKGNLALDWTEFMSTYSSSYSGDIL